LCKPISGQDNTHWWREDCFVCHEPRPGIKWYMSYGLTEEDKWVVE
jgi:hypothetical protein